MTTIYLIRHAQYASPNRIVPFRLPGFHLSPEGKQTAARLATYFATKPVAAIIASPLERTRETAVIIARGKPVVTDERLLEVRSSAQGKPEGFIESLGGWKIYDSDWYRGLNGERPEEVARRMMSFLHDACARYAGRDILVLSHGDPIVFAYAALRGIPLTPEGLSAVPYPQMGTGFILRFDDSGALFDIEKFLPA